MSTKKTKKDYIELAVKVITENTLFFIEDVCVYMGISKQTFYNRGLDEVDSIKESLLKNKVKAKQKLKKDWYKSQNPTLQIALYKLLGSAEECHRLNGTRHEIKSDVVVKEKYTREDAIEALSDTAMREGITVEELAEREGINLNDLE